MPALVDPVADAAEAYEGLRGLAHATRAFENPADTYRVLAEVSGSVRLLRQVLDQVSRAHADHRERAFADDGVAAVQIALLAADELHQAADLLDGVEDRVMRAHEASGRIVWHDQSAPEQSRQWASVVFLQCSLVLLQGHVPRRGLPIPVRGPLDPDHDWTVLRPYPQPSRIRHQRNIRRNHHRMDPGLVEPMGVHRERHGKGYGIIALAMVIGTAVIIALVLYLVLGIVMTQSRREFGTFKALGFTNRQIVGQLAVSLVPPLTVGTVIGIILCAVGTNPVMSIAMAPMGMTRTDFRVQPWLLTAIAVGIIVFGVIASLTKASRVRRILPISLLREEP